MKDIHFLNASAHRVCHTMNEKDPHQGKSLWNFTPGQRGGPKIYHKGVGRKQVTKN